MGYLTTRFSLIVASCRSPDKVLQSQRALDLQLLSTTPKSATIVINYNRLATRNLKPQRNSLLFRYPT
jgi:hypothetical protein